MGRPDSNPSGWGERVRRVYDRVAGRYDGALALVGLLGYRTETYRRRAVRALGVRPGQTVVDLGCGTGKNLPLLAAAAGPSGRVVGVDFSSAMLAEARARAERLGLENVELVEADAAAFDGLDRVLATFSLSMMPEPERVIARAVRSLPPDGRMAVLDFRIPLSWPGPIRRAAFALAAPLGETWAMAERDLRPLVRRHPVLDADASFYFGAAGSFAGADRLRPPDALGWAALLGVGFVASVGLEWAAQALDLWGYSGLMPTLTVLGHTVGLSPVVQVTTLPALAVWGAARHAPPHRSASARHAVGGER